MSTHDCKAFDCDVANGVHYDSDGTLLVTRHQQHDCGNPSCHLRYMTQPEPRTEIVSQWAVRWHADGTVVAYNSREYALQVLAIRRDMGETGTLVTRFVTTTPWTDA